MNTALTNSMPILDPEVIKEALHKESAVYRELFRGSRGTCSVCGKKFAVSPIDDRLEGMAYFSLAQQRWLGLTHGGECLITIGLDDYVPREQLERERRDNVAYAQHNTRVDPIVRRQIRVLRKTMSVSAVAEKLGISPVAIYRETKGLHYSVSRATKTKGVLRRTLKSKECCVCRKLLPFSAFYISRRARDGLQGTCRKCDILYHHKRRQQRSGR